MEPAAATLTSSIPLAETDLVPLDNLAAPGNASIGGVDYALNLDFDFVRTWFTYNCVTELTVHRTAPPSSSTETPSCRLRFLSFCRS